MFDKNYLEKVREEKEKWEKIRNRNLNFS